MIRSYPNAQASVADRKRDVAHNERMWIIAAGAVVVIQLWFGMISSSFWLDETGTWWIVKDGAADAVRRALFWSGQSPFFYLIEWCSSRLFGLNEIGLRIPSLLAMAGAGCFLYRIAERLYDRASAAAAAFVFVCAVSFYAIDARPYALAMLCLTASTWALLRWLDSNRPMDAILYVITAALVVYAHCIMSLGLVAGVFCAAVNVWNEPRRLARLASLQTGVALLCLPLVSQLRTFYAARSAHTFTAAPGFDGLLPGLIPCSLAGASILLVWVVMIFRGEADIAGICTRRAALLIGTWSLFAPLFLFLLAVSTDLRLYVPKYYSSALPGQALLVGGLLSSIRRSAVRTALIVTVGALSILTSGKLAFNSHGNEDWRAAMDFVRKEAGSAPVLLVSGFVEASDFAALSDPKLRDVFFAPELFYGEPKRSIRLPNLFDGRGDKDMDGIATQLQSESRFFLLTENPDERYEMWLMGRLGHQCRTETTGQHFGYLWITRFTCTGHAAPAASSWFPLERGW
jgi:mannosyltransferase